MARTAGRARLHVLFGVWTVVAGAVVLGEPGTTAAAAASASAPRVSGWTPWWNAAGSLASFTDNAAMFDEVSPFWYQATDASTIAADAPLPSKAVSSYLSAAHAQGVKVIPTITDATPAVTTGSPKAMANIVANATQQTLHVQTITHWVVANGFDGVDLDYEGFAFRDGRSTWPATSPNWIAMVTQLSAALHANGKLLEVSVPPIYDSGRTRSSGYWVYDYAGLATIVDRIKIMAYEFSSPASPGPIAPIVWVRKIVRAALKLVPATKLSLGIPAYGRDWVTGVEGTCPVGVTPETNSVTSQAAAALAFAHGEIPTWSVTNKERTFAYTDSYSGVDAAANNVTCDVSRTVWYMDAQGINTRVALAKSKAFAGVALWALGGEEKATWVGVSAALAGKAWKAPAYPVPPAAVCPPPPIAAPPVGVASAPTPVAAPLPAGAQNPSAVLDRVRSSACGVRVVGWAVDPQTDGPIDVQISVNGKLYTAAASLRRDDIYQRFGRGRLHGFDVSLPANHGRAAVCVTAVNAGSGKNTSLGCRSVKVS